MYGRVDYDIVDTFGNFKKGIKGRYIQLIIWIPSFVL